MQNKDDIISILNAVAEINSKPKKKLTSKTTLQNSIPTLKENLSIPSDVDKLIREAENYKKLTVDPSIIVKIQNDQTKFLNENALILNDEAVDVSQNKNNEITELKAEVKKLQETENQLSAQVSDLKKDKLSHEKIVSSTAVSENLNETVSDTRETLKSIYRQIEKQKKLFLDLKNHSIKIERDSDVYRENYERLVIENNELKTRLKIAKDQIVLYESNKTDLLSSLDQLNQILSKSNIVRNISPTEQSSDKADFKKKIKIESID
jgi:hypothetical protein